MIKSRVTLQRKTLNILLTISSEYFYNIKTERALSEKEAAIISDFFTGSKPVLLSLVEEKDLHSDVIQQW